MKTRAKKKIILVLQMNLGRTNWCECYTPAAKASVPQETAHVTSSTTHTKIRLSQQTKNIYTNFFQTTKKKIDDGYFVQLIGLNKFISYDCNKVIC